MEHIHQPLILKSNHLTVENSDVEGGTQITSILPIRLQTRRIILGLLLSITLLFPLACSWSKKLTKHFFFKEVTLEKATHAWVLNNDATFNIIKLEREGDKKYIINRKLKYYYQDCWGVFKPLVYDLPTKKELLNSHGNQYTNLYRQIYGQCEIEIPKPNVFVYVLKELTAPFYILQYFSCILWAAEGLAILAVIMISVSLIITTVNFFLLQSSSNKLREMAKSTQKILVYRGADSIHNQSINFTLVPSQDLVPGDIVAIQNKSTIPCDCVLLSGDLLLNEASLTGESIPIPKLPIDPLDSKVSFQTDKRHCLFEGTKVLQAKPEHQHVIAVVARTGFVSFKGQIFRSVLYPKQQDFNFYSQGIKYLGFLGIYVMLIYFGFLHRMISLDYKPLILFYRFFDALTWIIPPALPIFISMCMTYSLVRLRELGVFGIDPQKSLIAGKVNTVCFDKTGTLTTIGIDVYGYMECNDQRLGNFIQAKDAVKDSLIFKLFGSCHGTYVIDGEFMGDSLDVEMFKFSNYQFCQTTSNNLKFSLQGSTKLDVHKVYEFESALQRMSVLVQEGQNYYVFAKGSPEKIQELSVYESVPKDYKSQLDKLAMKGLRVLAVACRQVDSETFHKLLKGNRDDCEQQLEFLGFLAMENKLKFDTHEVISELSGSGLDLKIISGDNPLTTVQCARECGIITQSKPVLLVDYDDNLNQLLIQEIDVFDETFEFEEESQDAATTLSHKEVMNKLIQHLLKDTSVKKSVSHHVTDHTHCYAVSGKAFDYFWAQSPKEEYYRRQSTFAGFDKPLNTVSELHINGLSEEEMHKQLFSAIVTNAKVFARMRPEQKAQVIEQLQNMKRVCGMIGDGANDCAAIKQADVGISFAQSDAAFSSPYSSESESIGCVKLILLDGRAALQNACEVFCFYIPISVIKYLAAMLLIIQGQNFSGLQYIMLNYIGSLPYLKAISISKPTTKLSNVLPQDNMMAKSNVLSMSILIGISSIGLGINYWIWSLQDWKESPILDDGVFVLQGNLQSNLFVALLIYFEVMVVCVYTSRPFKVRIVTNKLMMTFLTLTTLLAIWLQFTYQEWQQSVLSMEDVAREHKVYQLGQFCVIIVISMVMVFTQEVVLKRVAPQIQPLLLKQQGHTQVL